MKIDDFCYIRCVNCEDVKIIPIPYENNYNLLSNMCDEYNELNECCNDSHVLFSDVEYGIENKHIKITDLPLALRKEFSPEVTHGHNCGKHSLVITKHNGDKVIISVDNGNVMVTDDYATTIVYVMDDLND